MDFDIAHIQFKAYQKLRQCIPTPGFKIHFG